MSWGVIFGAVLLTCLGCQEPSHAGAAPEITGGALMNAIVVVVIALLIAQDETNRPKPSGEA